MDNAFYDPDKQRNEPVKVGEQSTREESEKLRISRREKRKASLKLLILFTLGGLIPRLAVSGKAAFLELLLLAAFLFLSVE